MFNELSRAKDMKRSAVSSRFLLYFLIARKYRTKKIMANHVHRKAKASGHQKILDINRRTLIYTVPNSRMNRVNLYVLLRNF